MSEDEFRAMMRRKHWQDALEIALIIAGAAAVVWVVYFLASKGV